MVTTPSELPLSSFQANVEQGATRLTGRIMHCGRSAFQHLRKAWVLLGVDDEMAAFRAITAEEEAASALLLSLKQKGYPNSEFVIHTRHDHKISVYAFIQATLDVLKLIETLKPKIIIDPDTTPPRVTVTIDLQTVEASSLPMFVRPDEPLNFIISSGGQGGFDEVHTFEEQLRALVTGKGLMTF